jgi:hypothetical protein
MINLNITAPQGHQGLSGSDFKEISKWKMSSGANAEDINPADGYFKYYEQSGSLQLAINVVNNNSNNVKELFANFKSLLETQNIVVSIFQLDNSAKYKTASISSVSSIYSTGAGFACLIEGNVLSSGTALTSGKDCLISFEIKGIQGFQGFQGNSGYQGYQGIQGVQGFQGYQGPAVGDQGPQGYQGYVGIEGFQGSQGPQGFEGAEGAQGYQGILGPQGSQGVPGIQGVQGAEGGPKGFQGNQGPQGYQGYSGDPGDRGVQGTQGFQGPHQGYQGHQGVQGTVGNQGYQGILGPQGSIGTKGNVGFQGYQGYQGYQGVQGIQGNRGVQGVQGFFGVLGSQGIQGLQGEFGPQGSQGVQGVVGTQGTQGNAGFQGLAVQGPQGTVGSQGPQGYEGFQGNTGFQGFQGIGGGPIGTQGAQGAYRYFQSSYADTVNLLSSPAVGKVISSNDGLYFCSSVSPVTWKKYSIIPASMGQTGLSSTYGMILYLDAGNASSYPGSGNTWYDLSGNNHHAVTTGTPTYTASNGGGLNFNNISDYFSLNPHLKESYAATGFSVAAWVKADSLPFVSAIIERNNWTTGDSWALYSHFSNVPRGPRYAGAVAASALAINTVYYVGFTITAAGLAKMYINGIQSGSDATVSVPTASLVSPRIAIGPDNYPWYGDIYQLHIYNRALSAAEMLSNFDGTKSRYGL